MPHPLPETTALAIGLAGRVGPRWSEVQVVPQCTAGFRFLGLSLQGEDIDVLILAAKQSGHFAYLSGPAPVARGRG